MTSSDVFRSSSIHGPRHDGMKLGSSSPGLPPLADILPQPSTRSPFRSGSKALITPDDAASRLGSAKHPGKLTEGLPLAQTVNNADNSIEIIQITRPRRGRVREANGEKRKPVSKQKTISSEKTQKQSQSKKKAPDDEADKVEIGQKKKGTINKQVDQCTEPGRTEEKKDGDVDEPLNLEPATLRRVDWTPPAQKTVINIESSPSMLKKPASSECGDQPTFKDLVHGYACLDEVSRTVSVPSDDDSSLLKKRKHIELVAIQDENRSEPNAPRKSPIKKKAAKKKARTITEIATAAYMVPSPSEDAPASASNLDDFLLKPTDSTAASAEKLNKGKGKANPRKRPSKAAKRKPPPRPVLLSPGAALDQVAKQDFVFGTSSQLAREPSPSILRDTQAALKHSNQPEYVDMTSFGHSDEAETSYSRPRLWDAAARDADGDLFDVEIIDLVEGSPQLPKTSHEPDRFGYLRGGNSSKISPHRPDAISSDAADSFVNLSDILQPPEEETAIIEAGSPYFSESDMSTSTNIQPPASAQVEPLKQSPKSFTSQLNSSPQRSGAAALHPKPNYDLLTDMQLAKEVRTYGFKPIKKRSAMIAMLDQCWQSKARLGQAGIHTSTTRSAVAPTSTNSASSIPLPASDSGKKPRGRPRKTSINALEIQEPPPSAQPPETPKRSRGRPRKDSFGSLSPTSPQRKVKPTLAKKSAVVHSPAKPKKSTNPIIEIPDSESENGLDTLSSPISMVEEMFSSPPPLDLSHPATDDTELSLAASPSDQQAALFSYITKAIKSAPRTTHPANPSWHEKILMYDPLVLEDLAAWLNSGELTRVGYDSEVNPGEVKKWCESKSVCCLWRVNLRGQQRKRAIG
ncbi:hypothetical protein BGZ63DRAFT_477684 [Mariannaea sp. PMI_226]|nr:hypothetical protein BGZ63DRAFT_477684 [Mariannaea sp. PMI_226]